MRKAFTLVEMLIVVVVLVTLMTITFRLGAVNQTSAQRNTTVTRLQKIENCLSGYYAAFGSYPPVRQHGSYNFYLKVDEHGMQNLDGDENRNIFSWDPEKFRKGAREVDEEEAWAQVEAACRAQPVGCSFPYPENDYKEYVEAWADQLKEDAAAELKETDKKRKVYDALFDDGVSQNISRHSRYSRFTDWRDVQLFKFGLMSFLLPRYLIMMKSDESLYNDYDQWKGNNSMPSDPLTGQKYTSWRDVWNDANKDRDTTDYARVANIPSQAVCARWMPNLADAVWTARSLTVFGVDISDDHTGVLTLDNAYNHIHSPGGYEGGGGSQYMLDFCTVCDGWRREFYYYSPPPYQTYTLWSAGPDGHTFPPWISRDGLDARANRCVSAWTEDDIVNMSH